MEQLPALLDGTVALCAQLGSSEASKQFSSKQFSTAMTVVGAAPSMSLEVAGKLAQKIQQMDCWSGEQKEELLKEISNKAASVAGNEGAGESLYVTGRRPLQDFTHLRHYMVPSVLEMLQDASRTKHSKVEVLSQFACRLGLRCPSEPTYSAIVAIVDLVSGDIPISSEEKHRNFKACKPLVKVCCDNAPAHSKPYVAALPSDPTAFLTCEWGREVFADELPATCAISDAAFHAHWKSIPLRVTNIRASAFAPIERAATPAMVMGLTQHVLARASHERGHDIIPIQYLRPGSSEAPVPTMSHGAPHAYSAQQVSSSSREGQPMLAIANEPSGTSLAPQFTPEQEKNSTNAPLDMVVALQRQREQSRIQDKEFSENDMETEQSPKPQPCKKPAAATPKGAHEKAATAKHHVTTPKKKPATNQVAKDNLKQSTNESSCPLSMKQRLKLRPNGCSKCRNRPGCTPSCLRGSGSYIKVHMYK